MASKEDNNTEKNTAEQTVKTEEVKAKGEYDWAAHKAKKQLEREQKEMSEQKVEAKTEVKTEEKAEGEDETEEKAEKAPKVKLDAQEEEQAKEIENIELNFERSKGMKYTFLQLPDKSQEDWENLAVNRIQEAEGIILILGTELDQAHGYPDFNKPFSFWRELMYFKKNNMGPEQVFTPEFQKTNEEQFWGMFQYLIRKMKQRLYRQKKQDTQINSIEQYKVVKTCSQYAIRLLTDLKADCPHFVVTSSPFCSVYIKSVAMQPQKYWEIHGCMNFFQCEHGHVYHNFQESPNFRFDKFTMKSEYIPKCKCPTPGMVRPNVMMFNDQDFNTKRSDIQEKNFRELVSTFVRQKKKFVVIEVGASKEIPTLRILSEQLAQSSKNCTLIRIHNQMSQQAYTDIVNSNDIKNDQRYIPLSKNQAEKGLAMLVFKVLKKEYEEVKEKNLMGAFKYFQKLLQEKYADFAEDYSQHVTFDLVEQQSIKLKSDYIIGNDMDEDIRRAEIEQLQQLNDPNYKPLDLDDCEIVEEEKKDEKHQEKFIMNRKAYDELMQKKEIQKEKDLAAKSEQRGGWQNNLNNQYKRKQNFYSSKTNYGLNQNQQPDKPQRDYSQPDFKTPIGRINTNAVKTEVKQVKQAPPTSTDK